MDWTAVLTKRFSFNVFYSGQFLTSSVMHCHSKVCRCTWSHPLTFTPGKHDLEFLLLWNRNCCKYNVTFRKQTCLKSSQNETKIFERILWFFIYFFCIRLNVPFEHISGHIRMLPACNRGCDNHFIVLPHWNITPHGRQSRMISCPVTLFWHEYCDN